MLNQNETTRLLDRFLRDTDAVAASHKGESSRTGDINRAQLVKARDVSFNKWRSAWNAAEVQLTSPASSPADRAKVARVWAAAYFELNVPRKIEEYCRVTCERAEIAASSEASITLKRQALLVCCQSGQSAFRLMDDGCTAVSACAGYGSTAADATTFTRFTATLQTAGFLTAAAAAVRAMLRVQALLHDPAYCRTLDGDPFDVRSYMVQQDVLCAITAVGASKVLMTVSQMLMRDTNVKLMGPACRAEQARSNSKSSKSSSSNRTLTVPGDLARDVEALADSGLVAAVAEALLDGPDVHSASYGNAIGSGGGGGGGGLRGTRNRVTCDMHRVSTTMGGVLFNVVMVRGAMEMCGPRGTAIASKLIRAMRHDAVRRLQLSYLDRVAVHAGMWTGQGDGTGREPLPPHDTGVWVYTHTSSSSSSTSTSTTTASGKGTRGSRGGGSADSNVSEGGEGFGGVWPGWWLARHEAHKGRFLGLDPQGGDGTGEETAGHTAGWLETYHLHAAHVSFTDWRETTAEMAAAAGPGVAARPPPLAEAALACRTAEALCRLCRGQGLRGAYAPAPEWLLANCQDIVNVLIRSDEGSGLTRAEAGACMPYWLETAGWLMAAVADGAAAAMGRRAAAEASPARSMLRETMVHQGTAVQVLTSLAMHILNLVSHDAHGMKKLPEAARADVARRMRRCGLAASLDHALRLLFSAQDAGLQEMVGGLEVLLVVVTTVTQMEVVPPLAAPQDVPRTPGPGGAGGSSTGSVSSQQGDAVGGGAHEGDGDVLGLILTLSKRAALLSRALDAVQQGQGGAQRDLLLPGAEGVLAAMALLVQDLADAVRQRLAAAAANGKGKEQVLWAEDGAAFGGEAHEVLALAGRAACALAASVAWEVARMETGGRRPEVPLIPRGMTLLSIVQFGATFRGWCSAPPLLPPAQLMACQPHRLLAAASILQTALGPREEERKAQLGFLVVSVLVLLGAGKATSSHVRAWLTPLPAAAAGVAAAAAAAAAEQEDPCAGCLAAPLAASFDHLHAAARFYAPYLLGMMEVAAGGGGGGAAAANVAFQQFTSSIQHTVNRRESPDLKDMLNCSLPDGTPLVTLVLKKMKLEDMPVPRPVAPRGPLPPPLPPPPQPSRSAALPRVRACGYPRCGNFAADCEGALPLKQCGGCRAVRYCGADCQRAHWREGHKGECKEFARLREDSG